AAVDHRDALDPAGKVRRPRDGIGLFAADALDRAELLGRQIFVPAELLEHRIRELGITVLDFRADRIGALGQHVDAVALDSEAGAERTAAVHYVQRGVVEQRGPGVLQLRFAPAGPRQSVVIAL